MRCCPQQTPRTKRLHACRTGEHRGNGRRGGLQRRGARSAFRDYKDEVAVVDMRGIAGGPDGAGDWTGDLGQYGTERVDDDAEALSGVHSRQAAQFQRAGSRLLGRRGRWCGVPAGCHERGAPRSGRCRDSGANCTGPDASWRWHPRSDSRRDRWFPCRWWGSSRREVSALSGPGESGIPQSNGSPLAPPPPRWSWWSASGAVANHGGEGNFRSTGMEMTSRCRPTVRVVSGEERAGELAGRIT